MSKSISLVLFAVVALLCGGVTVAQTIVATGAYSWQGDSVTQGPFTARALSPVEIVSDYAAAPGYFMPVDKSWRLRNDISPYPRLQTSNTLLAAVYNMGLDEMVNAVEPDTTLRTGKEWAGVWTRDVSYSIVLAMAALQPQASMVSLRRKVDSLGRIVQDTGSGGAWPVSTDRMVWLLAAYEVYKVTGDRQWLRYAYDVGRRSLADDFATVYSPDSLVRGETSFIDWREQSYPAWMQTADIYQSEAMGTNVVHAAALGIMAEMAGRLGLRKEQKEYAARSEGLARLINDIFYMPDKGYYAMYRYGRLHPILNPREETLGEALAILYGIAGPQRALRITESVPVTPFGPAIFYPQIPDRPSYHNNALWPFVAAYWTLAAAEAGNEAATLEGIGSIVRPAALFATNKENFNLDNGDIQTELNSSNMLWSLSGNIALTQRLLFGINFEPDGLRVAPRVPRALADTRTLSNFPYRGARLSVTVSGYGDSVASLTLNGRPLDPRATIPAKALRGGGDISVRMADNAFASDSLRRVANLKAPITPVARLAYDPATGAPVLEWNPIEYIARYRVLRNGVEAGVTRSTSWPVTDAGEWQVIGVAADGTEGFASEPLLYGPVLAFQMPLEGTLLRSPEISYPPADGPVGGWHGTGFAETDQTGPALAVPVSVKAPGRYAVVFRYANGNGPVNTENKCAVRTLEVNGRKAGSVIMPQRGTANWYDWGLTNPVVVSLPEGESTLTLRLTPSDRNMNLRTNHALIDEVLLYPL